MQKAPESDESIPGGRFALFLGLLCLLLFGGAVVAASWDTKHRTLLESTEIVVMPDEGEAYFPAPHDLKVGDIIAKMDRRSLYLQNVAPVNYLDEDLLAIGLDDSRVYPIYQLRKPPSAKETPAHPLPEGLGLDVTAVGPQDAKEEEEPVELPNYLLLKIAPGSYLTVRDRMGD